MKMKHVKKCPQSFGANNNTSITTLFLLPDSMINNNFQTDEQDLSTLFFHSLLMLSFQDIL